MASVLTLEAKLERVDPTTPWGFRMQGGKEFGIPLTILKVRNLLQGHTLHLHSHL